MSTRADVARAHRVVVKVGSSSLTTLADGLDTERLRALVDVLAALRADGREVVLVSSGAIAAGLADCVVVFRALAQGQNGRFGQVRGVDTVSGEKAYLMPYGVLSPPQRFAMRVRRFMHEHGVRQEAMRAIAMASYHHAQANPRAVMHGKPLDAATYDASRWISPGTVAETVLHVVDLPADATIPEVTVRPVVPRQD